MSDMFVQNAWVWHVLVVIRMYRVPRIGWRWPQLAGITLFTATCISWPGVWAGLVLCVIAMARWWRSRDRQELRIVLMAVLGVVLALSYTAWRWLQVVDADALIAYFSGRYVDRGTVLNVSAWSSLKELLTGYRTGYLPVILLVVGLAALRWRRMTSELMGWPFFATLAVMPVLLDHFLLLQYAGHDFAVLKGGLFLCVAAGLALSTLPSRGSVVALAVACLAGVLYFYRTNPIASSTDEAYTRQMEQGLDIATMADDDMVFTLGFTPETQVQWYAKRTLFRVDSIAQAQELLRSAGVGHGLVVTYAEGLETMERIDAR
jgi:hypothetical protein